MTRTALGALAGVVAWLFTAIVTGLRVAFTPWVWERVTFEAVAWTLAYAPVFAVAGVACGELARLPPLAKYPSMGAVIGALLWSYLTVTWAFTARTAAVVPPAVGVLEAVLIGALLGAAGGLLLLGIVMLRRH